MSAVLEQIADLGADPKRAAKVLLLGNTGVGKSYLCNLLLERAEFQSKVSATSVTGEVEAEISVDHTGRPFVVYNIPGLLEADAKNIQRNKDCIKQAFLSEPDMPTLILFVMVPVSGRPAAQDIAAFKAVSEYLKLEVKARNALLAVVLNKVDRNDFEDDAAFSAYEVQVRRIIKEQCEVAEVRLAEKLSKAEREDFDGKAAQRLRAKLVDVLAKLKPARIALDPQSNIELEADKYTRFMEEAVAKQREMAERHRREMTEQSEAHKQAIKEMMEDNKRAIEQAREAHEAKLAVIQESLRSNERLLEEHKDEIKKLRESQAAPPQGLSPDVAALIELLSRRDSAAQSVQAYGGCVPPWSAGSQMPFEDDEMTSPPSAGRRSRPPRLPDAAPPRASGQMSWNEFEAANKGKGLTKGKGKGPGSMSYAYREYKESFRR